MEWVEWNESEVEWSEMEMGMRWRWSEMTSEMKWRWKEKERRFLFLENIECQVFLIFTLHFLYKTANLWLVFRLIRFFFFLFFFFCFDTTWLPQEVFNPMMGLKRLMEVFTWVLIFYCFFFFFSEWVKWRLRHAPLPSLYYSNLQWTLA